MIEVMSIRLRDNAIRKLPAQAAIDQTLRGAPDRLGVEAVAKGSDGNGPSMVVRISSAQIESDPLPIGENVLRIGQVYGRPDERAQVVALEGPLPDRRDLKGMVHHDARNEPHREIVGRWLRRAHREGGPDGAAEQPSPQTTGPASDGPSAPRFGARASEPGLPYGCPDLHRS